MTLPELNLILDEYKLYKMELKAFEKEQDYARSKFVDREIAINKKIEDAAKQIAQKQQVNGAVQIEAEEYSIAISLEKMCPNIVVIPRSNIIKLSD